MPHKPDPKIEPVVGITSGAELHHELKSNPGVEGDPTHTKTEGTLPDDLAKEVAASDANTEIASQLKSAARESEPES